MRDTCSGRIVDAGKDTGERGARLLRTGSADLIAFGRPFTANPDSPERIANGWPPNPLDPATLDGGAEGA